MSHTTGRQQLERGLVGTPIVSTVLIFSAVLFGCGRLHRSSPFGVLSSVGEIIKSPEVPTAPIVVHLSGTLTNVDIRLQRGFLQDATGGVQVENIMLEPHTSAGDLVEM